MNRTLDILRSPVAMMVALMLALTAQGKHTADVFTFFSHPERWETGDWGIRRKTQEGA